MAVFRSNIIFAVNVTIILDAIDEGQEEFVLILSNEEEGANISIPTATASVIINDFSSESVSTI